MSKNTKTTTKTQSRDGGATALEATIQSTAPSKDNITILTPGIDSSDTESPASELAITISHEEPEDKDTSTAGEPAGKTEESEAGADNPTEDDDEEQVESAPDLTPGDAEASLKSVWPTAKHDGATIRRVLLSWHSQNPTATQAQIDSFRQSLGL